MTMHDDAEAELVEMTVTLRRSKETVSVTARRRGGRLVFQGDILLMPKDPSDLALEGVAFPAGLWTEGVIPFEIETPDTAAVQHAIQLWNHSTVVRLTPRNGELAYVVFTPADDFSASAVGRQGGRQEILVAPGASFGEIAHEIGHAAGLWHEHARLDRDPFIEVRLDNVAIGDRPNFKKVGNDAENLTPYDYDSIMHYDAHAFALTPALPTIIQKQAGPPIGQRDHLSANDREAVRKLYA